jgi:hypothetical protein
MGKVLEFKRVTKGVEEAKLAHALLEDIDDDIGAIVNDYSLTPANRRWLLENMLMDIDDQLEGYKRELERAEMKLAALVETGAKEIEAAYNEYIACVTDMTHSVRTLTRKALKTQKQN